MPSSVRPRPRIELKRLDRSRVTQGSGPGSVRRAELHSGGSVVSPEFGNDGVPVMELPCPVAWFVD